MQAAKKRHGDVRVAVDETGEDQLAAGVDGLRGGVFRFDFGAWADRDDGVAFDGDRAVVVGRRGFRPW